MKLKLPIFQLLFKTQLLFVVTFFTHGRILAQSVVHGIIVDIADKPIEFVHISINSTIQGTYTNAKGEFTIENLNQKDSLKLSCIGYERKAIAVKDLKDKIVLTGNSVNIKEVTIERKKKNKSFMIGYYKMRSPLPYTHGSQINSTLATFIPYESTPAIIETILLPIKNMEDSTRLKVYLFEISKDGKPGNELFSKLLLSDEISNKIDISDQQIRMPAKGVFVALEWLNEYNIKFEDIKGIYGPGVRLKMTPPMDTNLTYQFRKNEWRLMWNLPNEKFRNARFGLELKPL